MEVSKNSVDKAGEKLRQMPNSNDALDVLAAWRNKHVYALNLAFNLLKRYTDRIGNHAVYGQRLKRVDSIVHKLQRLPKAKLSRLQDIGGCRVILNNYDKLISLYIELKKSRAISSQWKDYITYPKVDGYRGIHLIYNCRSNDVEYTGLKIELQLRTKLQHAWATAVEIIDSFEGERLKLGQGSHDWQEFFYLTADAFARDEKLPVYDSKIKDEERLNSVKELCDKLEVIKKLEVYAGVIDHTSHSTSRKENKFFILKLMIKEKQIIITPFNDQIEAQYAYITLEKEFISDPYVNVLMVKMNSLRNIKKSYPNYFADSTFFLQTLKRILALP